MTGYHIAEDRTVLRVSGADRVDFLQGIVSNDVAKAGRDRGVWAAFLTPQGKYLHDFFLAADAESILLDCERARAEDLHKRLRRYTLRSDARVEAAEDLVVALASTAPTPTHGVAACFPDPRHREAGFRLIGARIAVKRALEVRRPDPRRTAGVGPAPPGARPAGRLPRHGNRTLDTGRGQCRPAGRHRLGQGLLDGPGGHRPDALSRPRQAAPRADARRRPGAAARRGGRAERRSRGRVPLLGRRPRHGPRPDGGDRRSGNWPAGPATRTCARRRPTG